MTHQDEAAKSAIGPKILSQHALKLLAFELSRELRPEFYFEAALLLEAHQVMQCYQIPLARLHEFWHQDTLNKLISFSTNFTCFCAQYEINMLPEQVNLISKGCASVKASPFGIFFLSLLQIKEGGTLEQISSVFTSPFLSHDLVARHAFDAKVRKRVHAFADLKAYSSAVEAFEAWQNFAAAILPDTATLAEWLRLIEQFVYGLGIKTPASFLSELQVCFLSVNPYFGKISYAEFLLHVQTILADIELVEDAALAYAVYLQDQTEFSAVQERPALSMNPFLPRPLLQEYQALGAFEFSDQDLLVQLGIMQDLAEQGAARFLSSLNLARPVTPKKAYQLVASPEILQRPEQLAQRAQIGGTALLNEQNACAFKAFAHFQLRVSRLDQEEAWLSAKLKGIATHRILERIWTKLKSQQQLLSLSIEDLRTLVTEITQGVLLGMHQHAQFFLPQSLANLELKRMVAIILLWLAKEKKRPPFQIGALEQERLVYLGALVIKLRIDRIDELPEGHLVIDYKTGALKHNLWSGDQMQDVQLPLYLRSTEAEGVAFAEVGLRPKFGGLLAETLPRFSELKYAEALTGKSWQEVLAFWQQAIENLGEEILQGKALIAPKPGACEYCDLQALCRIKEKEQA